MAVYKLNSKKKKERKTNTKKVVGFSLIAAASLVFFFLTGIVPIMQTFLLGLFGVFGYPLCIVLFVVGLALVNNRRYVMSKKYTVCLILTVFFALCILQLAIVGNKFAVVEGEKVAMSFGDYLAKNYLDKWTAGGFVIGFFTTIFLYLANLYGAYIIFALLFIICLALLLDTLKFLKKQKDEDEPVSIQIKDRDEEDSVKIYSNGRKTFVSEQEIVKEENKEPLPNVVLNGNLKEEEQKLTARQILGLDKKLDKAYGFEPTNHTAKVQQVKKEEPKSLRELILTPPKIDINEYFKDVKKYDDVPPVEEVKENVSNLKTEGYTNSSNYQENNYQNNNQSNYESVSNGTNSMEDKDDFSQDNEIENNDRFFDRNDTFEDKTLPEVKSDELVEKADDILRQAVEEEKNENPDIYENVEDDSTIQNDRDLSVRDRNSEFSSRDRFSRETFESSRFYKNRENLTQDDIDARDTFSRDYQNIAMRNGTLSRQADNVIPKEEPAVVVPYEYDRPPIDLITTKSVDLSSLEDDVIEKSIALENSLDTFGIAAKVTATTIAPAVTRYELEMPQGVPVIKVKNHASDIALALAAEGSIRIEAPIPGRSVVGVEVPNTTIATVSLKDVINSKEFMQSSSPLTFAIGKDISGNIICADMKKLTHLLVAGSTGSGKSVCLNSIILSMIYKASPKDVKIILIDPKQVEFSSYEDLPHLIMPKIVCDVKKAVNTLSWAVDEMERRYAVMRNNRVKHIDEYNQLDDVVNGKVEKMPFIVIIVDELANLMTSGKKDVEEKINCLAQKSRACGIHLILATQRPSVDVLTGQIKNNIPSRIAFAVTSSFDSMTILDRVGAEKLLGKGDMLYHPNGAKEPKRVQGCFISTKEINDIVDYARDNNEPIFDKSIEAKINNPSLGVDLDKLVNNEVDALMPHALRVCMDCGQASSSMLRRKFAIGYPRAARIIEQMENAGYVSTADGAKGRTVYITEEEFRDLYGDAYDHI